MRDESQSGTLIDFGPFTFDKALGKLSKHGTSVRLRGMPLKILHHLVEHPGEVVSRGELQRLLWNGTAYGDFEQGLNSAVNVVRKTLSDSADQPRYIETVPGQGYRFIAPLGSAVAVEERQTSSVPEEPQGLSRHAQPALAWLPSRRHGVWAALLPALLVVGFFGWRAWRGAPETNPGTEPFRARPLTTVPGVHRSPSFSPDGNHVTFTWNGRNQHTAQIYVQQLDAGSPLQLTAGTSDDYSPVWSPDGRWIAFLRRAEGGKSELRLIAPLGGPERKLAEVRPQVPFLPVSLAWCPDSRCVVVTDSTGDGKPDALFVISVETREKRQLTHPGTSVAGDTSPAVSPDGRWLVFRRDASPYTGELYQLRLGIGLTAAGEPQRLTPAALDAGNPAFMPGGREILFTARGGLWRLSLAGEKGGSTPARLPFVGEDGIMPVVSQAQPGRLRELHLVIELGKSNHVTTAVTAITVEEAFVRIYQKAGFVVVVQGTKSHQSTAAELPGGPPIMSLQILQQTNLSFQFVEGMAAHGLLALIGRIRQSAPRSQTKMVGVRKKCRSFTPALIQHHRLTSRRRTHRRTVDESGKRVGSLHCGAACSAESPATMCSQACCRQ